MSDADRPRAARPRTVAERRFAERAAELAKLDLAARVARVYETNLWSDAESRSGAGSSLAATARLRAELPALLRALGVRRLLATTFPGRANADVADGDWRPLDLERPPFAFPPPAALLVEGCEEEGGAYADKSLGAWAVAGLPRAIA